MFHLSHGPQATQQHPFWKLLGNLEHINGKLLAWNAANMLLNKKTTVAQEWSHKSHDLCRHFNLIHSRWWWIQALKTSYIHRWWQREDNLRVNCSCLHLSRLSVQNSFVCRGKNMKFACNLYVWSKVRGSLQKIINWPIVTEDKMHNLSQHYLLDITQTRIPKYHTIDWEINSHSNIEI